MDNNKEQARVLSEEADNQLPTCLVIRSMASDVVVQRSLGSQLKLTWQGNKNGKTPGNYSFRSWKENTTVYGEVKKNNGFFDTIHCMNTSILVEIPDNFQQVTIESLSGDVHINHINVKNLKVSSMSGDISASGCTMDSSYLSSKSGDISVDASVQQGNYESVSGDVTVSLKDSQGYTITYGTVSGDTSLRIQNQPSNTKSGIVTIGDGACQLNVHTVSGDISIRS